MRNYLIPRLVFILLATFFMGVPNALAGKGATVKGVIIDKETGETLPGATIRIEGTQLNAVSDLDGKFSIHGVPEGKYTIIVTFISYTEKKFENIVLKESEPAVLNVTLSSSSQNLNEVVVEAEAKRESVNAMLIMQKNSISVSDGVSAELIRKTPDRNSSDVLKRVSGTSIQDNKFAIVRGLNDRYNAAFINGAPLPSSESDRKAFSFEIFPANLLDNITILKSASADMPADFAGGTIIINTRNIPEENTQQVSLTAGYNELATFKPYTDYKGGKYDWMGFDDGSRKMPSGLPTTAEFRKMPSAELAAQAKNMTSDWSLQQKASAPLNYGLQYSIGRHGKLFGNELGTIFALTYNNSYKTSYSVRREFQEPFEEEKPMQEFELKDTEYANQVMGAALANISYKINGNHVISIKNLASLNAEDKVVLRDAIRDYSLEINSLQKGTVRSYTQNKLICSQIGGDHLLTKKGLKLRWNAGISDIKRDIPNLRRMIYDKSSEFDSVPYTASIAVSGVSVNNGGNMFFSNTAERLYNGGSDLTVPLPFIPFKTEIKSGVYYQEREREFNARNFSYTRYNKGSNIKFKDSLLYLPEDQIFLAENMGELSPYIPRVPASPGVPAIPAKKGVGGFKLEEGTKLNDSYTAGSVNQAAYIMLDTRPHKKLHLVGGVRAEQFRQYLQTFEDDGDTIRVDTTVTDILPSGTLIYSPGEKTNIRLSYAQTLSRPEFRELAPFGFYDFVTDFTVRGNPALQRALIHNFDLRYEFFPGMGQLISASVFYKQFSNAIEQVNRADVARELYYANVKQVDNYGAELEYRFNAGWLLGKQDNQWLSGLTLYTNLAYIISEVDVSDIAGARAVTRPLQGQSPYIVNAGIQFTEPVYNISLAASANKVGRRIAIVGNTNEPDIWENPRNVIDLQLSKTFFGKLEVKLAARDILAQDLTFYQDLNTNGKFDEGTDNQMSVSKFASTYTFGITYKIH